MRRLALLLALAATVMALAPTAEAQQRQRHIMRPGPYYVPQPMPRPQMHPYSPAWSYWNTDRRVPWVFGHGVMQTCYMIRNGRCYYY